MWERSIGAVIGKGALFLMGCFSACSPRCTVLSCLRFYPVEGRHKIKNTQRQYPPNRSIAAPDANLQFSDFERKEASGGIPESLLLPSRLNCWLRNCTESADGSRAVTASREHAHFRRKLYAFSVSWPCGAVNTSCGQKRACILPKGGRITLWAAMKILPFYGRRLRCGMV